MTGRALLLHEALDEVDQRLVAIETELLAWLAEHPLPETKKRTGTKTDQKPPEGGGDGWDWTIFTLINGPWVNDPNSVIYQSWNPGLFR